MTTIKRLVVPLLIAIVLVGAGRFMYGMTRSAYTWTSRTHLEIGYGGTTTALQGDNLEVTRRWGPLFIIAFEGLQALELMRPRC